MTTCKHTLTGGTVQHHGHCHTCIACGNEVLFATKAEQDFWASRGFKPTSVVVTIKGGASR